MLHPNYLSHVADDAVSVLEEFIAHIKNGQASRFQEALLNNSGLANTIRDKKIDDLQYLLMANKKLGASLSSTMQSVIDTSRSNLIAAIMRGGSKSDILKRYEQYASLLDSKSLHTAQSSLDGLIRYANRQNIAMSNVAHTQWMNAVDTYTTQVNLQLMSTEEAVRTGLKDLASQNLEWVDYVSGHRDRADVALRRVLRTEANQTGARITENYLDVLNIDLVETSAHIGARPEHFLWQGQVFSRTGAHGYPDFYQSTGYGTVTGLCGANCRHSFGPYFEEAGPTDWNVNLSAQENERVYDLTQQQRALERKVREKKRKLYSAMPGDDKVAKHEVSLAQKHVREFVKENPELTREYWREWQSKFKPEFLPDTKSLSSLSEAEMNGITWYTNKNESRYLSTLLRGPFGVSGTLSRFNDAAQNLVKIPQVFGKVRGLFSALNRSSLNSDMVLYRGLPEAYITGTRNIKSIAARLTKITHYGGSKEEVEAALNALAREINTGKIYYNDRSFISTSKSEGAASGFGNILCEFRVPKGTKGIDVQGLSYKPREYEVLLNRGIKARLVDCHYSYHRNGKVSIRLILEVVK